MNSWAIYAAMGLVQVSLLMTLYKVPAAKQINKYTLSVWSYFFASILAGIFLYNYISFDVKTVIFALLWGTGYSILSLTQMHVLHKQDTSSVFPFTSLVSNILVIIGGVLFLNETITFIQWVAVSLSVLLFISQYWNNKIHFIVEILPSFMFISLLSTFNKFIQKAGADHVNIYNFIFWQLTFALIASFIILFYKRKHISIKDLTHGEMLKWSAASGVLQFGVTYTIIKALSLGPISLVHVIIGLYTFFTSLLASLFFKEKITAKGLFFIFLSFLIVLLIKFG
ncbi:MAG: EamA family transporter [Candidatus Paceibacterota bacterium]|jgi:drug/metabolite transporter (DMT)-like permease